MRHHRSRVHRATISRTVHSRAREDATRSTRARVRAGRRRGRDDVDRDARAWAVASARRRVGAIRGNEERETRDGASRSDLASPRSASRDVERRGRPRRISPLSTSSPWGLVVGDDSWFGGIWVGTRRVVGWAHVRGARGDVTTADDARARRRCRCRRRRRRRRRRRDEASRARPARDGARGRRR